MPALCRFACLWAALTAATLGRAAEPKPNIILFLADDLGYADIGVNGCKDIPTPHIDAIARNGVRFTDGYAAHPVCSPSRAALMSGMYQHRFGFEHNSGPERYASPAFGMPRDIPSLAEKLKSAGYATGMVGKWHIGFQQGLRPHERGFDMHYGFLSGARSFYPNNPRENDPIIRNGVPVRDEKDYLTDAFAREAVDFITRSGDRPWFLYVAFNAVHSPLEATEPYEARFPHITDKKRKTYAGMLSALDDAVGRVMDTVRRLGREEQTLVMFYSDNGGPTAETSSRNDPLRGYKGQMFEGGIRVPFVMQWKGRIPAGTTYRPMVMGFDFHATALAAAGAAVPGDRPLDGVDLVPYVTGQRQGQPHDRLFWRAGPQHAARLGDWKLVVSRTEPPMLFHLREDIGEQHNLAGSRPDKLQELQSAFAEWEKGTQPAKWVRQDHRNAEPGGKLKTGAPAASKRAMTRVDEAFGNADKNGDGKLSREEYPQPEVFNAVDADKDGSATLEEVRQYFQNRRGGKADPTARPNSEPKPAESKPQSGVALPVDGKPALKQLPDSDAVRDAAGVGQLFECIHVPGITDVHEGMNGLALVDLNRDGRMDLIATYSPPLSSGESRLALLINQGGFRFTPQEITIRDSTLTMKEFGGAAQIPNLADFNGDGFLDILITRSAPMQAGKVRAGRQPIGMTFLLSDGAWDRFIDVSHRLGARNELGYNRQTSIGDVNGDGWLDIAIGCDNIKNAIGGLPHSRLYVFMPNGPELLNGKFQDIGGTDLVPDFGGFYHDSTKDKAGPGISLRDLDNDGDLDLVQSYHTDVRQPLLPYWPGEYRQGVMCWTNQLRQTGTLRFEKVTGNGLHCEARLKYNRQKQLYEPAGDARAPGLPYLSMADVDGDGLQDILGVGPDSDYWVPRVEHITGRFWKNLGDFRFEDRTTAAGFAALNNTYGDWMTFFDEPRPAHWTGWKPVAKFESQPGLVPKHPSLNSPYFADSMFADYDNDGSLDVVVMNRSESLNPRAMLFMGRGDGMFEVMPTTFSGLDASGISAEAADLNGDGLIDLLFAADPDNSAGSQKPRLHRYESKVYWNTGAHGARQNHWLHLTFTGVSHARLIGARVELTAEGKKQYRWIHSNHSYKSGGALDAHFGLGKARSAEVKVTLPNGKSKSFNAIEADQSHQLSFAKP
jgi:arylsulfatase A-like enzyme